MIEKTLDGQEVLEEFVTEKADVLRHDHVDRHHLKQLLQGEKERTVHTVTLIIC